MKAATRVEERRLFPQSQSSGETGAFFASINREPKGSLFLPLHGAIEAPGEINACIHGHDRGREGNGEGGESKPSGWRAVAE